MDDFKGQTGLFESKKGKAGTGETGIDAGLCAGLFLRSASTSGS